MWAQRSKTPSIQISSPHCFLLLWKPELIEKVLYWRRENDHWVDTVCWWHCFCVCYVDGWGRGIRIDVFLFFFFCGPVSDETINLTCYRCFIDHRADVTSFVRLRLCDLYLTVSTIWLQCGNFHLNQTSNSVLANKGVEPKEVFSLKVDALIFQLWSLNLLWGWKGKKKKRSVSPNVLFTLRVFLPKFSSNKGTWIKHLSRSKYSKKKSED